MRNPNRKKKPKHEIKTIVKYVEGWKTLAFYHNTKKKQFKLCKCVFPRYQYRYLK